MEAHNLNMCDLLCRIFLILLVSELTLHSCISCSCYKTPIVLDSEFGVSNKNTNISFADQRNVIEMELDRF